MSQEKKSIPTIKSKIKSLLGELNEGLYEKEETMGLVLLAILAGESAFLLGEPGTAKSLIARRIADGFDDVDSTKPQNKGVVKCFEYLMNQFSTPDEVFGPVSLEALKNDEYKRITDRFLPKAQFAFLDEIWKASPAIQNSLLTILNEKKFHNGSEVQKVPLIGFVAASNELPAKGEGLDAIFDRFLVRIIERPISGDGDFFNMVTAPRNLAEDIKTRISEKELLEWQKHSESVELPESCREVIRIVRRQLAKLNEKEKLEDDELYVVSDRRWKKIVGLLKMSAFANGRSVVNLSDCLLISYCLWSTVEQNKETSQIVEYAISQCAKLEKQNIDMIEKRIQSFHDAVHEKFEVRSFKTEDELISVRNELDEEFYWPIKNQIESERNSYSKSVGESDDEWNSNIFVSPKINVTGMFGTSYLKWYDQLLEKIENIRNFYLTRGSLEKQVEPFQMVDVECGRFIMGSASHGEGPMHAVTLYDFSLGSWPVTYGEFYDVMGLRAPDSFAEKNESVRNVSWYEAITYCNMLSIKNNLKPCYEVNGVDFNSITYDQIPNKESVSWSNVKCDFKSNGYRLPTEAEWEFAARGGNNHENSKYSGTDNDADVKSASDSVCNSLGLYGMSGGVKEMCWDVFGNYLSENVENPTGPAGDRRKVCNLARVCRGGSNADRLDKCTVTARDSIESKYERIPTAGFRVCRSGDWYDSILKLKTSKIFGQK